MPKFRTETELGTALGKPASGGRGPGGGADDLLARADKFVTNARGLAELLGLPKLGAPAQGGTEAAPAPDLEAVAQRLIKAGLGDRPIGQLMQAIAPYTINQIKEGLKNVAQLGPGR